MEKPNALAIVLLACLFFATATGQTPKPGSATETATKTDQTLITSLSSRSFQQLVQAMGFECSRVKDDSGKEEESYFLFRAEGYKVAGFVGEGFVQLYNAFTDVNPELVTVNEWNKANSHCRAYVDGEKNAVLESELIISGGVTRANVEMFVKTYRDNVARWARFVLDHKK